jgi:hypothetical protein
MGFIVSCQAKVFLASSGKKPFPAEAANAGQAFLAPPSKVTLKKAREKDL